MEEGGRELEIQVDLTAPVLGERSKAEILFEGHSNEVALNVIADKCLLQFGQNDASGQFSLKVQKAIEDAPTAIQDFELKFKVIKLWNDLKDWDLHRPIPSIKVRNQTLNF